MTIIVPYRLNSHILIEPVGIRAGPALLLTVLQYELQVGQWQYGFRQNSSNQWCCVETSLDVDGTSVVDSAVLAAGADVLAPGADVLAPGADVLAAATDILAADADVLAAGAHVLAAGADMLAAGADVLAAASDVLVAAADVLAASLTFACNSTSGKVNTFGGAHWHCVVRAHRQDTSLYVIVAALAPISGVNWWVAIVPGTAGRLIPSHLF